MLTLLLHKNAKMLQLITIKESYKNVCAYVLTCIFRVPSSKTADEELLELAKTTAEWG